MNIQAKEKKERKKFQRNYASRSFRLAFSLYSSIRWIHLLSLTKRGYFNEMVIIFYDFAQKLIPHINLALGDSPAAKRYYSIISIDACGKRSFENDV